VSDLFDRLLAALDDELPAARSLRERLHAAPELSWQEEETVAAVAEALAGIPLRRVAGTSLVATVGSATRPGIGVRAELDALPIEEATGATFAATNGAMHCCGHDVHTAALTALVRAARRLEAELPAPLVALFQPSEETYPSGACRLVDEGALDGLDAVVAAHVHPLVSWGTATADGGPVNAASDNLRIVVEGAGGHAAYPHEARDPIVALAQTVVALQQVVSRRTDPMDDAVVSIGWLRSGTAENVIPAEATAGGTLRVLQPDARGPLRQTVTEIVEHTAAASGCRGRVEVTEGEPAIVNDGAAVAAARRLLERAGFGTGESLRSCGSDDLGFLGVAGRLLLIFVGVAGAPGGRDAPLHHAEFLPPSEAVDAVARAQAAAYVAAAGTLPLSQ
jgi:amidohydrolase